MWWQGVDRLPFKQHLAFARTHKAGDGSDSRAFASSIAPDDGNDLPLLNLDGDSFQSADGTIVDVKI
jgi:hypothetical protein